MVKLEEVSNYLQQTRSIVTEQQATINFLKRNNLRLLRKSRSVLKHKDIDDIFNRLLERIPNKGEVHPPCECSSSFGTFQDFITQNNFIESIVQRVDEKLHD